MEEENLHVTLLFLGEVEELDLVPICRIAKAEAEKVPPFTLEITGLGCFPNPRRPKILWVGVGEGTNELTQLHDGLEAPLMKLGCYRREDRAYHPHLTLGRLNQEDDQEIWSNHLREYANWDGGEIQVTEILVMGSEHRRDRYVYSVFGRAKLKGEIDPVEEEE